MKLSSPKESHLILKVLIIGGSGVGKHHLFEGYKNQNKTINLDLHPTVGLKKLKNFKIN